MLFDIMICQKKRTKCDGGEPSGKGELHYARRADLSLEPQLVRGVEHAKAKSA